MNIALNAMTMNLKENSEAEVSSFFDLTPDLVCIAGKDGFFRKVNHAVMDKLGYTKDELFARPISSFIFPEDVDITEQKRANLLNGNTLVNFENRYINKNGKSIWLHWTSFYLPDKEIVFAIAKDITERKQAEKEIDERYQKFKSLANHFKSNLETERKQFAIELHEELAQLASVIKMDLNSISNTIPDLPNFIKSRITHAADISSLLIQSIRRIAFQVSPYLLNDNRLNDTLESLCKDFSLLNEIPCILETDYDEADLSQEVKIDFFRICQASLSNVLNDASSNSVKISIKDTGSHIELTISEDDTDFDRNKEKQISVYRNMHERVASINGQLTIQGEMGEGRTICVTVAKPKFAISI